MAAAPSAWYEFGPFRIDPEHQAMLRDGKPIAITPKVFAVLLTLVRHSHELVTKDELLRTVWPGRVVEESNLSQCIFVLRKLLGDPHGQHQYIVTLPGRGYRFSAALRTPESDDSRTIVPTRSTSNGDAQESGSGTETGAHSTDFAPGVARADAATPPIGSIAVLPFGNDTDNVDERYFSDGLSEGLITALSQFAGLKVVSGNSSFHYRNREHSTGEIGRALGVAHVLEGSVHRQREQIRITATLVRVVDGSVVLSRQYDGAYADLFALQDTVAHAVADAFKAKVLSAPGAVVQNDRPPSGSLAAWVAFQHGRAYEALATEAGARSAISAYERATGLDPGYAEAHARLSGAWVNLWSAAGATAGGTIEDCLANARAAATTALRMDAGSARAHHAHATLLLAGMDWEGARAEASSALRLAPNDPDAQFWLAAALATLGQNGRALALLRAALIADPRRASWYKWLSITLAALGQLDAARDAAHTSIALQPGATDFHAQLALIEILRGDADAAGDAARQETPGLWRRIALAMALQIGPDRVAADNALAELVAEHARDAAYQIAEVYALRRAPDEVFKWLERAWGVRDGGLGSLLFDPLLLRHRADPRFAAFCRKVGLPETTDAVAMP